GREQRRAALGLLLGLARAARIGAGRRGAPLDLLAAPQIADLLTGEGLVLEERRGHSPQGLLRGAQELEGALVLLDDDAADLGVDALGGVLRVGLRLLEVAAEEDLVAAASEVERTDR